MHMYACVDMSICMFAHEHACVEICVYVSVHCMHASTHTGRWMDIMYVCVCMCKCMYASMYVSMYVYVCTFHNMMCIAGNTLTLTSSTTCYSFTLHSSNIDEEIQMMP